MNKKTQGILTQSGLRGSLGSQLTAPRAFVRWKAGIKGKLLSVKARQNSALNKRKKPITLAPLPANWSGDKPDGD